MRTQEIQMNGFTYQVTWTFGGQERPYADTKRVAEIITEDTNRNSILELMKVFFRYNVPLKENWNYRSADEYFRGYCVIVPIEGGFQYTKVEPYTD
jgi:hypothetical protein